MRALEEYRGRLGLVLSTQVRFSSIGLRQKGSLQSETFRESESIFWIVVKRYDRAIFNFYFSVPPLSKSAQRYYLFKESVCCAKALSSKGRAFDINVNIAYPSKKACQNGR